jgi:CRISPR-associated RAMP protein (TIGR02581 family)
MTGTDKNRTPDFRTFHSRLVIHGTITLRTGLRVGAGRDTEAQSGADVPVVKLADGSPYIPGSSFKGAWRVFTESLLRGIAKPDQNLACISVPRDETTPQPDVCLTSTAVARLKSSDSFPQAWSAAIGPKRAAEIEGLTSLDEVIRQLSCRTCRLFGAPWLAGKVWVKDLSLNTDWRGLVRPAVRDGVAIDRDKGTAADKQKYTYEVVPEGTLFDLEILIQNADVAELGLAWLGLSAFRQGLIPLGGARSRGLGWCELGINWEQTRLIGQEMLVDEVFPDEDRPRRVGVLSQQGLGKTAQWRDAFLQSIGWEGVHGN